MSRYIDADKLCEGRVSNDPVVIAVKCEPTADVEKVVHCSECKFFNVQERTTEGFCRCDVDHLWQPHCNRPYREPSDFCSRGVKTDWKDYHTELGGENNGTL